MSAPVLDDPHGWTDAEWQQIEEQVALDAARIALGRPSPFAVPTHGFGAGPLPLSGAVTAARHGGKRPGNGLPRFGVLHSAETPLATGYAGAIAQMFATTTQDKSCTWMTDPAETWGVLDPLLTAWHCGTGNTFSIGLEQSGRAAMTRAQWLVPAGWAQLGRNAEVMRYCDTAFGIGRYWMTDQQLRDAHAGRIVGGWATHDQCREILGGTSHTDPGDGFPYAEQMSLANDDGGIDNVAVMDLLTEIVGELRGNVAGKLRSGWPGRRFGRSQMNGTVVDYLAEIDREVNSLLDVKARGGTTIDAKRPALDTLFGHVVSARAELGLLRVEVDKLVRKAGA